MKRYLHRSPREELSAKKRKQLKLETFLFPKDGVSTDNEPSKNLVLTDSNPVSIPPLFCENFHCSLSCNCQIRGTNADDLSTTKKSTRKIRLNEDCAKVPYAKSSCFAAELLSEVCFISAESLILLLERLSLIEAQLQTIFQLATNTEGPSWNPKERDPYLPSNYLPSKVGSKDSLICDEKVTRIYQTHQVALWVSAPDFHRWNTKTKILASLSKLLNLTIAAKKLKQFHFLPPTKGFSRIFLTFSSRDIPRRIFQSAPHLKNYCMYPSRVFKDADPKPFLGI